MTNIIHLESGLTPACSSFRRASGFVAFSLAEYHAELNSADETSRPCKTCYPHYVRRMNAVNRKRIAAGKEPKAIRSLPA